MRVRLFRRSRTWWVYYRAGPRRVRYSLKTDNRKVAEDHCAELEWSLRQDKPPTVEKRRVTVLEFLPEYENDAKARKRPKSHATDLETLA